jgi:cytochrome c-type biogenesis protein CcmH/NrfG
VRNETQFRSALALLCVAVGVFLLITTWSAYDAARSNRLSANSRLVGNLPEAIESGLRATRSDPGRAEYWDVLGLAYAAGARWRDASSAFERANKLAPHDVRYVGDLVATQLILASDGDPGVRAKALQLADQATRTDPNNPAAQLTRATVMQATGNLPEARRSAERALALDPESTNSNLYVLATQVALDSGSAADAVEIARRGIAKLGATPKSVDLRYELARALVANGQPRDALTEIDAALAITPNNARCQQLRAEIRARLPM